MSRVGKKPIVIPANVKVSFAGRTLNAKGQKGELSLDIPEVIDYSFENNTITFSRSSDDKKVRALHGLTRALANNVVEGVNNGFKKILQIEGVGYKVEKRSNYLLLSLGFSHPCLIVPPNGIELNIESNNVISVAGIDKQLVGAVAAKIRELRKPEPYKGKGIRYQGEYIRRKAGKTTSK